MSRVRAFVGLSVGVLVGISCGDSTTQPPPDPVPTTINLSETSLTFDALTATANVTATVLDQDGDPMSGQAVTWSSSTSSVATVNGAGRVTAVANGTATITATAGEATATLAVEVVQVATQMVKVEGDGQSAGAGQSIIARVELRDRLNNPVPGGAGGQLANTVVQFTVASGGGSVDPVQAQVQDDGRAGTTWTLGQDPDQPQELNAQTAGGAVFLSLEVPFTATASAGPADGAQKIQGDAQTGPVAAPLPDTLIVRFTDEFGNPIPSMEVALAVTVGGGSVSPTTAFTNSNGDARAVWTLGPAPGANELTASDMSGSVSTTFTATGVLGPPDSVVIVAGDGQSATVNTAVATDPVVRVVDAGGNALEGETVAFSVVSGSGTVANDTVTTDAQGEATAGTWTLDTLAGPDTLLANVPGGPQNILIATGTAGAATSIAVFEGDNQSAVTGEEVAIPPAVLITDQYTNPVAGETVDFAVTLGGGSVTGTPATSDSAGVARVGSWALGPTVGANELTATHGVVGSVVFNATAVEPGPGFVEVADGDNQVGLVDFAVNIPPSVLVRGRDSLPFEGATVVFEVASGGGSVTGDTVVSDTNGLAEVGSWVLGGGEGVNTLTATVQDTGVTGNPVTFTATGQLSQFNIEIRFPSGVTPTASQQAAFDSAEAFWERAIMSEHADIALNLSADACGLPHPAVNETIDDLLIFASFDSIDGTSGVLARAGFCVTRSADTIPVFGLMQFDTADVAGLEAGGQFDRVILHEMGHVLGFTRGLWTPKGFLEDPSIGGSGGEDTHFDGPRALDAFLELGGGSYTGGAIVPVENSGVPGQADSHWRETVFDDELMTPFIDSGLNPLSILTIASFWDVGYTVNLAAADSYSQVFTGPPAFSASGGTVDLGDDEIDGPRFFVDRSGRLIRIRSVR